MGSASRFLAFTFGQRINTSVRLAIPFNFHCLFILLFIQLPLFCSRAFWGRIHFFQKGTAVLCKFRCLFQKFQTSAPCERVLVGLWKVFEDQRYCYYHGWRWFISIGYAWGDTGLAFRAPASYACDSCSDVGNMDLQFDSLRASPIGLWLWS